MQKLILGIFCALIFMTPTIFGQEKSKKMNVAILLYNDVELLDFAGPGEVFAAARGKKASLFNVYTLSKTGEPIISQGFLTCNPTYNIKNCPKPDILVIPGGNSSVLTKDPEVIAWIKKTAQEADHVLTVCTGAFALAKTGLLDGMEATTFHSAIQNLRDMAPEVKVHDNKRFVDNGPFITTAGVSAGIDGSLHLVSRLYGAETAKKTAEYMEYDKWQPGMGLIVNQTKTAKGR